MSSIMGSIMETDPPTRRENPMTRIMRTLRENGEKIAKLASRSLFKDDYYVLFESRPAAEGFVCSFELENPKLRYAENYSRAVYYQDGGAGGILKGRGLGVYAMGHRVGQFLFYLQLLLCIKSEVFSFELDNRTDDPERAKRGIYSLLYDIGEDTMIFTLAPDRRGNTAEGRWEKKMEELIDDIQATYCHLPASPWNCSFDRDTFLRNMKHGTFLRRGGAGQRRRRKKSKRKKSKRKTSKRKTSRRKKSKRKTSKRK